MSRALIIVGHGSTKNPNTRKPICAAVNAIRARGVFEEVVCGLWKEEPHISKVLDLVKSSDVTVVPFFISDGYYTKQVIPREMGLAGPLTFRDGRVIRYTKPIGAHPLFAELIVERAQAVGATGAETLVVLGHGTPKNPNSAKNVYLQADRVRAMKKFAEVITLFIDQEPLMSSVFEQAKQERIIMVPLFVADGWHVTETIPEELAELAGDGRSITYAQAVGTDPRIAELLFDLATVQLDVAEGPLLTGD